MTAYFPKYNAFSVGLKGMDYEIASNGRRYKVTRSLKGTYVESAFDELVDEPRRELTKDETDALDLQPEKGGKRTHKNLRKRTLRKRFRKTYTKIRKVKKD
jgi:hypothetical protein